MELVLDPTIRPEFETYHAKFDGGIGFETEVWVCKTSNSFGMGQEGDHGECDTILLSRDALLKLQSLVNQAVDILEEKC